jgi:REP element-mobilizing transposase RayT
VREEIGHKVRDWTLKNRGWNAAEIIEGHVSMDQVHFVPPIPPKYSVSELRGTIRGRVAMRLLKNLPEVWKKYRGAAAPSPVFN